VVTVPATIVGGGVQEIHEWAHALAGLAALQASAAVARAAVESVAPEPA
jgi:hypothetical protein